MACVIMGCKSHSSRKKDDAEFISFHRFPTDIKIRQKWIEAIARSNWEWKKQHRICSKHFDVDSFINMDHKWRRLISNAVPSLYLPKEMKIVPTTANIEAVASSSSTNHILSVQEQIALIHRVTQLEQKVEELKKTSSRRLLKLNALRRRTKRLTKKNTDLNSRFMNLLKKRET